jgi:hypothetical protein
MPFELTETTPVRCTNANPRTEIHGKDENGEPKRVRAIDLTFTYTTENTVLDAIAPGLREHFFHNKAADASQESLANILVPLPNIRFPQLKTEDIRWEQPKARGFRWVWDWGREAQHVDFSDVAMGGISFTLIEGGSAEVKFSVSYNGDELEDNTLYGELCGMATMGDAHIQLFAPADLIPVKKGYRAGKPDTPQPTDNGAPLLEQQDQGEEDTPEKALAASVNADLDQREQLAPAADATWPFPLSAHETKPRGRRRNAGAAA